MPKKKPVTDEEHLLAALGAAKAEGAKALLVEIGLNTISTITIFLDDDYRGLLQKSVTHEFVLRAGRLKRYGATN